MKLKPDEELMILVRNGKEDAFSELYHRYQSRLLYFFYKMLNFDEEKAQDFLQDLFVKIIEKPEKYDPSKKFSTWVYTVAANMCKNEYRNSKVRQTILNDIGYRQEQVMDGKMDGFDRKEFQREFNNNFKNLDKNQQLLITLRFQQELPLKEIADIMDIPEGTVKSRIFYLMKNLAIKFKEFKTII